MPYQKTKEGRLVNEITLGDGYPLSNDKQPLKVGGEASIINVSSPTPDGSADGEVEVKGKLKVKDTVIQGDLKVFSNSENQPQYHFDTPATQNCLMEIENSGNSNTTLRLRNNQGYFDLKRQYSSTSLQFTDGTNTPLTLDGDNVEFTNLTDGSITIDSFVDEDNMSSNSATKIPTQQSVKAYVDNEVAGLVDSAPAALDTLNELAAALNDDASFSTTITNSLALKAPLASPALTGTATAVDLDISGDLTVAGKFSVGTTSQDEKFTLIGNGARLEFDGVDGGGGEGILYVDSGGGERYAFQFPGSDKVVVSNRASNGTVEIRANTSTAGASGEQTIATFEDDQVSIAGNLDVTGNITNAGWTGDVIASAYLDSDTAHLTGSQTFSGTKTFSSSLDLTGISSDSGDDNTVRIGRTDAYDTEILQINSNDGYLRLGPYNESYCHFVTDRPMFYFNQDIAVDTGLISSFNEDLIIRRVFNDTSYNQITLGDDSFELKLDNTARLSVDGDGNVGIGTTSPSAELHISTSSPYPSLLLESTGASANIMRFTTTDGTFTVGQDYDDNFSIANAANITSNRVFTILKSNGNVGIGLTAPTTTLDVNGTANFSDDVTLPDSKKIYLGNGNDLEIHHNGSNSVIKDNGTGDLSLQSNGAKVSMYDAANGAFMAKFNTGAGVELYHNGTEVFETTSTGVNIEGTVSYKHTAFTTAGPTDNVDVSDTTVLEVDTSGGSVTIGGFTGGVQGQILYVVKTTSDTYTLKLENNEGGGSQDIFSSDNADISLVRIRGGVTLYCNGTSWFVLNK